MPTKRHRRTRNLVAPTVPVPLLRYFETGEMPEERDEQGRVIGWLDLFLQVHPSQRVTLEADWRLVREGLLVEWTAAHPGTRPWAWWHFDAPPWTEDVPARAQALVFDYPTVWHLKQPRRRLGGVGTPTYEVLNFVPAFEHGLPVDWVTDFFVKYYNGRARDIHGHPIGTEYHEGHFPGLAPRRENPPIYESEAAFLDRHGVLTAAERRRLPAAAFEPETIDVPPDAATPDLRQVYPRVWDKPCFDETRPRRADHVTEER